MVHTVPLLIPLGNLEVFEVVSWIVRRNVDISMGQRKGQIQEAGQEGAELVI